MRKLTHYIKNDLFLIIATLAILGSILFFVFLIQIDGLGLLRDEYSYGYFGYVLVSGPPIIAAVIGWYLHQNYFSNSRYKVILLLGILASIIWPCVLPIPYVNMAIKYHDQYLIEEAIKKKNLEQELVETKALVQKMKKEEARNIQKREETRWPHRGAVGYLCYKPGGAQNFLGIITLRPDLMENEACEVIVIDKAGERVRVEYLEYCLGNSKGDRDWIKSSQLFSSSSNCTD